MRIRSMNYVFAVVVLAFALSTSAFARQGQAQQQQGQQPQQGPARAAVAAADNAGLQRQPLPLHADLMENPGLVPPQDKSQDVGTVGQRRCRRGCWKRSPSNHGLAPYMTNARSISSSRIPDAKPQAFPASFPRHTALSSWIWKRI